MPRPKKNSYRTIRPPFSYISLCAMAIESSPTKMMTLREMYQYVAQKFEFYRYGDKKWKNSLRHNLSFNDCFIKVEKNKARGQDRGRKGSYWKLHPKCREMFLNGSTLRRKKRFRETETMSGKEDNEYGSLKSSMTTMPATEGISIKTTQTESVFSDRSVGTHRYTGLSLFNTAPLTPYKCKEMPRKMLYSGDSEVCKKSINSSLFTIESILRSNKRENIDDTERRGNIKGQELQTSTYVPAYSFGQRKPMDKQIHVANKRVAIDYRNSYCKRYKMEEISFKQPQYCCPYCIEIAQELSCRCDFCLIRYSTL